MKKYKLIDKAGRLYESELPGKYGGVILLINPEAAIIINSIYK
nr:hypothetical protein [uncultured Anaerosporobacter sp.]